MGLDFLTFLDYSWGTGFFLMNMLYWSSGLFLPLYVVCSGPFWYASCREWAVVSVVIKIVDSMLVDQKLSYVAGSFQLMLALFISLMCLNFGSLLPFSYPMTSHISVTGSLAFPFWGATVFSCVNMNWRGFLAKFMVGESFIASVFFHFLEVVTVVFRSVTLSTRMSANILVSLIFAKFFFSSSLGVVWISSIFAFFVSQIFLCLSLGYYIAEWFISFIQCWLFVTLLTSYVNEAVYTMEDEIDSKCLENSILTKIDVEN
uniref:ATP synthase subunit a n=1 Tax=Spisula sachalinensis TaxID=81899 RepID=A0A2H4U900_SPISA|nr:ATP synthase F0 subunit 6 [Pseudocardium sachalinense]